MRLVRIALLAAGTTALLLALGFFLQMPWTVNLWPLPAGRLSYLFVQKTTRLRLVAKLPERAVEREQNFQK